MIEFKNEVLFQGKFASSPFITEDKKSVVFDLLYEKHDEKIRIPCIISREPKEELLLCMQWLRKATYVLVVGRLTISDEGFAVCVDRFGVYE